VFVAKGDVSSVSAADVIQLEGALKDESARAFKIGQRYCSNIVGLG
jgi:hypothetical protein